MTEIVTKEKEYLWALTTVYRVVRRTLNVWIQHRMTASQSAESPVIGSNTCKHPHIDVIYRSLSWESYLHAHYLIYFSQLLQAHLRNGHFLLSLIEEYAAVHYDKAPLTKETATVIVDNRLRDITSFYSLACYNLPLLPPSTKRSILSKLFSYIEMHIMPFSMEETPLQMPNMDGEDIEEIDTISVISCTQTTTISSGELKENTPQRQLQFNPVEQLNIFLTALHLPHLRNNCLEIFRQNSAICNYQLLSDLLKACADTHLHHRTLLVRQIDKHYVCFREPFGRLVDLVTCGLRKSVQAHLLMIQLCKLAKELCIQDGQRRPKFEDIISVAQHLPIFTHAVYLLRHDATCQQMNETELSELLDSMFAHPLLTGEAVMPDENKTSFDLPKLIVAEGLITAAFTMATRPGRKQLLQKLFVHFKKLCDTLDTKDSREMDQYMARILLNTAVRHGQVINDDILEQNTLSQTTSTLFDIGTLHPDHITMVCYELLTFSKCSPAVANAVCWLQRNYTQPQSL